MFYLFGTRHGSRRNKIPLNGKAGGGGFSGHIVTLEKDASSPCNIDMFVGSCDCDQLNASYKTANESDFKYH